MSAQTNTMVSGILIQYVVGYCPDTMASGSAVWSPAAGAHSFDYLETDKAVIFCTVGLQCIIAHVKSLQLECSVRTLKFKAICCILQQLT